MQKRFLKSAVLSFILLVWQAGNEATAQTVLLDNFESTSIRVVQPNNSDPTQHYLWNQYPYDFTAGPDDGMASISTDTAYDGTRSCKDAITTGNIYLQFLPYDGTVWNWMRDYIISGTWQFNTFNRMRIWIKVPSFIQEQNDGFHNMAVGTFLRASKGSPYSAEDGGGHVYSYFNIPPTTEWFQMIVDTHPDSSRGLSGGTEVGDQPYPTGESGFNYFDAMTRFYIDGESGLSQHPANFYIDKVELYRETNPVNIDQVHSLGGVYVPSTNMVYVSWRRHKDENYVNHEVRYAFQDIFQLGWTNATPAPNGIVAPLGWQGYAGMKWSSTAINVAGHNMIYIAIKPQNSNKFNQIAIPISSTPNLLTAPLSPASLTVQ